MIYAIGDIHGCLKHLRDLLSRLPLGPGDELVFLGDYIDRGPDSKGVVDFLIEKRGKGWRFLRGNHEQMLLDWLAAPGTPPPDLWLINGGVRTLRSYLPLLSPEEAKDPAAGARLQEAIPPAHRLFFQETGLFYDTPEAYFCHAGVDLGKPLDAQSPADLLWVRESFRSDPRACPKLIVHAHTPNPRMDLTGDRINLDTGCVYGGPLTALRLPDRRLFQSFPYGDANPG